MKTLDETTAATPDVDTEIVDSAGPDRRRRRALILPVVLSVLPAILATILAMLLSRRRREAAAVAERPAAGPRPAPSSTINVNWGFALFGSNVMGERRRRGGGLRDRLSRRR